MFDIKSPLCFVLFAAGALVSAETLPLIDYRWHSPSYPPGSGYPYDVDGYFEDPESACRAFEEKYNEAGLPIAFASYELEHAPYPPILRCYANAMASPANGKYSYIFYAKFIPYSIAIEGVSVTNALPSMHGSVKQIIKIRRKNGDPISTEFYLKFTNPGSPATSLTERLATNSVGEYEFIYIPPYLKEGASPFYINARCDSCENEDSKVISVLPVYLDEPQMCLR